MRTSTRRRRPSGNDLLLLLLTRSEVVGCKGVCGGERALGYFQLILVGILKLISMEFPPGKAAEMLHHHSKSPG
jgi:hypothetical protein